MIPVYRNVDSPNGDFGLTRQEGDEEFVVLTKAEYAALCPVTSPGAHGEGEAVTLWKYRDSHVFRRSQPRSYRYGIDEEFKALPAAAFDALVASRKDAEESVEAMTHVLSERIAEMAANAALLARANTAKAAADLMRARAERAEAAVEAAYRDGYGDGYKDGANDEQGSDVDGAWKHSDTKAALGRERA